MASDFWPPIKCKRFDGESARDFERRSSRIVEIMTAFRKGRIEAELADDLEQELLELQEPGSVIHASTWMSAKPGTTSQHRRDRSAANQ